MQIYHNVGGLTTQHTGETAYWTYWFDVHPDDYPIGYVGATHALPQIPSWSKNVGFTIGTLSATQQGIETYLSYANGSGGLGAVRYHVTITANALMIYDLMIISFEQ